MKITLAQLNYIIGDFEGNLKKIINVIHGARDRRSNLVVFSELAICGYPPLDLLEHKYFIERCHTFVNKVAEECKEIAVMLGAPDLNSHAKGKNLFNAAFFLHKGKTEQIIHKALLPTYDIFDEYRYFEPGTDFRVVDYMGSKIAVTVCEDLWYEQPILTGFGKDKLYSVSPLEKLCLQNPDFIINIAASPFSYTQETIKRNILSSNAQKYNLPLVYVNQVGANTELIFDGGSMVLNRKGEVVLKCESFKEDIRDIDIPGIFEANPMAETTSSEIIIENIHNALVSGISDYFRKMGFSRAVLGLSGGIDSAVTLVLAVEALGKENVRVLMLPSKYSSGHSVTDAVALAETLGVRYDILSIKDIVSQFDAVLKHMFEGLEPGLAEENIQARIRGNLLMAISNKFGNILLNTSNKSEAAVGYGTLYGDMSGGLSVLGDVYKTDVYRLARYINREREIIPENTIIKPPSAELRPDQKDSDSLPDYDILDKILFNYIELKKSADEIIRLGIHEEIVHKTIRMVNANEYKRYQTPPILRISSKAFGMGRRMPLVAKY
ncbi:MAG: NAD+ synthase [Bacteroidales bacterium]|nr:NAD+ synthase [Bacteroidales bacterium]